MALKVTLTFCFIFALWTSASAELLNLSDDDYNQILDVSSCGSQGGRTASSNIKTLRSDEYYEGIYEYRFQDWDENSIVRVCGEFRFETGSTKPFEISCILMDKYAPDANGGVYSGRFAIYGGYGWAIQNAILDITVRFSLEKSAAEVQHFIKADSRGAFSCVTVSSKILSVLLVD